MTRLTEDAKGVYVIAVTPFGDDGALDFASIDSMVDFYGGVGVTGLTVLGQLGEAPKLTAPESRTVVERVLKRLNGRLPVVVGVSRAGACADAGTGRGGDGPGRGRRDGCAALDDQDRRPGLCLLSIGLAKRWAIHPSCCRTIR